MKKAPRIEICGNIASGKTTLSKCFHACGLFSIEEQFLENPFIKDFYKDPCLFSFETEISFLLQHYHAIKTSASDNIICDYSFTLDKAYADVTLSADRRHIYMQIADELEREIGFPTKIIYLQCPELVLMSRIRKRCRDFESSINLTYLESLTHAINNRINMISNVVDVITINSHAINFVDGIKGIPSLEILCLS
jgi:deoxyadenosine/deoxycytidine kinase